MSSSQVRMVLISITLCLVAFFCVTMAFKDAFRVGHLLATVSSLGAVTRRDDGERERNNDRSLEHELQHVVNVRTDDEM